MQSEPRTFEHSNIPRWWIVVTLRDRSKKLTSGLEWTMTPYDDILTFALPHSWLYSLQFSSSGSHCCFPTCRHVLKREASSRHECLNKSFSISNSWAKHLLAEKKNRSCYGFKVEELGCWKVELSFCRPMFSCAAPCQEAQEILQMAGQGSEEPISISNTLQSLGANE